MTEWLTAKPSLPKPGLSEKYRLQPYRCSLESAMVLGGLCYVRAITIESRQSQYIAMFQAWLLNGVGGKFTWLLPGMKATVVLGQG
jgi:hypothetical protein